MQAGDRVGLYRLVERLGKGGFAEVWRARPEPATAWDRDPDPRRLPGWLEALAAHLRDAPAGGAGEVSGVVENLARSAQLLGLGGAPDASGAPVAPAAAAEPDPAAGVRARHLDAAVETLAWVERLAAGGQLDLAVKVPFHPGYVRQMRREKDILRRVTHKNLVRQVQVEVDHDPPYLAMEWVRGWSLRDALRTEPLPPMAKLLAVIDQLLAVLDHLHRRGIVHGDVKPENVMLEPSGALRLIDLGLGQVSQAVLRDAYLSLSLASRVPIQGTLAYMAPEVRRGEPPSPSADVYSAAIVLYELLVGDVPHGMARPTEAAPQRELSPRFDILLKWALHPEPARRIPSAGELRERVLLTLRDRPRHQVGTGARGVAREGTTDFDRWALEQASPFVQGDWVGPFQLEEPLGRGGFGEVWRAREGPESGAGLGSGAGREVALKVALGPHGRAGLEREAEIADRLDHPRIPKVRARGLDADPPWLAVDLVRGRSLRVRLNEEGRLDPATAAQAVIELGRALVHCHARGVVHQDLKPENLLLDEAGGDGGAGALHLLDFGLAATASDDAGPGGLEPSRDLGSRAPEGGTFEYMAPERRRGEPGGPASDVYAVGVILFEALTAQLPRGLTRLRELCPDAPLGLQSLCERMLDPDPAARPPLGEVVSALERDRPRAASRRYAAARRALGGARWGGWPIAAALCATALAALAAGWTLQQGRAARLARSGPGVDTRTPAGVGTTRAADRPDVALRSSAELEARASALAANRAKGLADGASRAALAPLARRVDALRALAGRRAASERLAEDARFRLAAALAEHEAFARAPERLDAEALERAARGLEALEACAGALDHAIVADPATEELWTERLRVRGLESRWRHEVGRRAALEVGRLLDGRATEDAWRVAVAATQVARDDQVAALLERAGRSDDAHAARVIGACWRLLPALGRTAGGAPVARDLAAATRRWAEVPRGPSSRPDAARLREGTARALAAQVVAAVEQDLARARADGARPGRASPGDPSWTTQRRLSLAARALWEDRPAYALELLDGLAPGAAEAGEGPAAPALRAAAVVLAGGEPPQVAAVDPKDPLAASLAALAASRPSWARDAQAAHVAFARWVEAGAPVGGPVAEEARRAALAAAGAEAAALRLAWAVKDAADPLE